MVLRNPHMLGQSYIGEHSELSTEARVLTTLACRGEASKFGSGLHVLLPSSTSSCDFIVASPLSLARKAILLV